ncbi:MAG: hypothetical protein RBG13Loki_3068 [Promethearchaeota archaeon CR_4]|nr:MAG: hypothetical protein RBG13Loki_3068 [Candidatus Lokiarchaeota archaeon CR_4]
MRINGIKSPYQIMQENNENFDYKKNQISSKYVNNWFPVD